MPNILFDTLACIYLIVLFLDDFLMLLKADYTSINVYKLKKMYKFNFYLLALFICYYLCIMYTTSEIIHMYMEQRVFESFIYMKHQIMYKTIKKCRIKFITILYQVYI